VIIGFARWIDSVPIDMDSTADWGSAVRESAITAPFSMLESLPIYGVVFPKMTVQSDFFPTLRAVAAFQCWPLGILFAVEMFIFSRPHFIGEWIVTISFLRISPGFS
jgi:hypothetical protein